MSSVRVVKQLSLFLRNEPGALANMFGHLSGAGVNVLALTVTDSVDHAVIRFVVDDPRKAIHVLEEVGALVLDTDILALALGNQPGQLTRLGVALSEARVNIEYAYGGLGQHDEEGILYLRVSDLVAAQRKIAEMLA